MSLQVWLPLNGDLHNQGLLDKPSVVVLQSGNSFIANGKIGQCLSSTSTNVAYFLDTSNNKLISLFGSGKIYTMAFWYKLTGNGTSGSIILIGTTTPSSGSGNGTFGFWWTKDSSGTNPRIVWNDGDNGKRILSKANDNSDIATDYTNWHHLVAIIDKTNMAALRQIFYIDGIKVRDLIYNNSNANALTITNTNNYIYFRPYYALLNDVRIYDHALSDKEVEEIAKGLVLHYKLDNIINANLLEDTPKSYSATDYCGYLLNMTQNLIANEFYTIQLWDVDVYHSAKTAALTGLSIYWGGGSVSLGSWIGSNFFTLESGTNYHADYLVKTFPVTSSQASGNGATNTWLNIYNSVPNANGTRNMHIGKWKLEKGRVATPYGINVGTIYDSSGYNYNGSLLGFPVIETDPTRYGMTTYFNGVDDGILIENLYLSDIINNEITYSFWIKPLNEANKRSVYFGSYSDTSWSIEKTTGNVLRSYWNGSPDTTCTGAVITDNVWLHICIVKNGTSDLKVYINGVQKFSSTATLSAKTFPTTYRIGRDTRSGDGTPYDGYMSDFRIYATALTEKLVLELYNTSATIDNKGNIYARELVEI